MIKEKYIKFTGREFLQYIKKIFSINEKKLEIKLYHELDSLFLEVELNHTSDELIQTKEMLKKLEKKYFHYIKEECQNFNLKYELIETKKTMTNNPDIFNYRLVSKICILEFNLKKNSFFESYLFHCDIDFNQIINGKNVKITNYNLKNNYEIPMIESNTNFEILINKEYFGNGEITIDKLSFKNWLMNITQSKEIENSLYKITSYDKHNESPILDENILFKYSLMYLTRGNFKEKENVIENNFLGLKKLFDENNIDFDIFEYDSKLNLNLNHYDYIVQNKLENLKLFNLYLEYKNYNIENIELYTLNIDNENYNITYKRKNIV